MGHASPGDRRNGAEPTAEDPVRELIYEDLVSWYRLLDPTEDHAEEAELYRAALEHAAEGPFETLLELGAGAGNNGFFLKRGLRCTLSDLSEPMLALSRALNPECEHVLGDMRTLRLDRTFDAVVIHDAIVYMRSEAELEQALRTAWAHTRPGGAAILAPDCVRESFHEDTEDGGRDEGRRGLRSLAWMWDPDPADTVYTVDYALLLREGDEVSAVHDRHLEGLFPLAAWTGLLERVGFRTELVRRPLGVEEGETSPYFDHVFLARRPAG